MANTVLNLKINAQFDELTQLNAEAQRSRDRLDAMAAASKILGKSVDNTDAAIEAHLRSLKTLQQNLDRNSKEYKQAQQEIKKYSQELKDAGDDINKQGSLLDKIGGQLKGFGVAMAAAFSVDAIVSFTQELAQSAIQIENYAIATGTTIEEMSRMSVAAQKTGVDVNDLGDILKDLVEKIDILQRGEGGEQENNLVRGLEQVGVALKNTDGSYRDAYDILVDYGRATQDLTKDQKLAANAMLVLENGNMQYLSAVQKLSAEQGRQAPLTQRQVDALKELHEAQVEFNVALQTLAANVLPGLLRGIKSVVDAFIGLPSLAKEALAVIGTSAINPAIGLNIIGNRIRQAIQGTNNKNDDLKFIPPDIGSIPKKITEQTKNSIMAMQAELTKLQDRLVRAVTDIDRAQLQTKIEEVKKTIAEMDGSAAQEREKLAEQEAKKANQLAEKQAQERKQIEQKIYDLRAGYEQDIADQRINALKRIQELERDFIKQRGDAESKLADAILRRDRAREDADLRFRLRSGELTQEQFDLITQSNTYTRNHQDAVLTAERERLEIQEQYLQNVGAIAQAELESKQQVIDLDKRYLTSQQNILRTPSTGLNKLPSQGQLPPPPLPATGLSYTGATPRGQKLTFNQIAQLAHSVGFNNQDSIIMAGIVMAESSGHTQAFNGVGYDLSYGLAQINMLGAMGPERRTRFGINKNEDLYDPETNLRAAYRLYQDRGGENSRGRFDDWTTFTQGIFKQYLPNDASRIPLQPVTVQSIAPQAMQPLFALADKFRFSTSVSVPTTSLTDSQTQLGSSPFGKLEYQNFAGRFGMGAQVFGGQPNFAGLLPYPGQIQSIGMQAAGMNLQAAQYGIQPQYPSDLTNPRSGALAMAQQQFQITLQQLALERQVGQEVANRVIKVQEESRIEAAALQQRNQDLQLQIRSGNLDQQQIQSLQNEIVLNQDKLTQLQQLPTLYQQELVAQQQQLQMINMERQLQSDIANIISQNITQGIMNLIQGSQSLGEVLNNIVLNVLNQILQKLIAMVIEATVLQAIMAAIGGGGGIFGIFGNLFGGGNNVANVSSIARASAAAAAPRFANGGIMTADGTLPLSRYARGGIARSPQLAMFGEGSMPEAYVPLPDGRTIPVTIKGFANGGVYYPQRYNVFDDPFLNTLLTGMPDTALSRRYQEDDVLRQRMDSVFDEYVGTLYTILDDVGTGDVSSNHIQQLFARSVEDLVADNREFFDDTQFSDYLINRGIGEFFTNNENAYNLMQRSGAYDSENVGAFISNMQRQAFGIIRNQEQFEAGRRLGISGMLGDYYRQLEPTQNYFNDRVRDEQNPFFRMIRESAGIPLRGYQKPQKYARGGIARSPQLAMFGEGSMPEAFVPLPDGRTIPVSLMGGGGSNTTNNVSVSINANGLNQTSDSVNGAQLGRRIARAVQDEISRQQRPGGSLR